MRRLTISVDDELANTFDALVREQGYENRSEAFRDLVRQALDAARLRDQTAKYCVGALSYVYNHHERSLAGRLAGMHHDHHDLTVAATHAHLDHDHCIETVILKGPTQAVLRFADSVKAQPGVRHGNFNPIPVDLEAAGRRRHVHAKPSS